MTERNPASRAEGERFELSSDLTARNGFRDRRIRPLCHPSAHAKRSRGHLGFLTREAIREADRRSGKQEAEKEGFEPSKEEISPLTP